jgi:hypothetical protein
MSISFFPSDQTGKSLYRCDCEDLSCKACGLNTNERNARELGTYIGFLQSPLVVVVSEEYFIGRIPALAMIELCEARLSQLSVEPARPMTARSDRAWEGGLTSGYMRDRTAELLSIAHSVKDQWISWS